MHRWCLLILVTSCSTTPSPAPATQAAPLVDDPTEASSGQVLRVERVVLEDGGASFETGLFDTALSARCAIRRANIPFELWQCGVPAAEVFLNGAGSADSSLLDAACMTHAASYPAGAEDQPRVIVEYSGTGVAPCFYGFSTLRSLGAEHTGTRYVNPGCAPAPPDPSSRFFATDFSSPAPSLTPLFPFRPRANSGARLERYVLKGADDTIIVLPGRYYDHAQGGRQCSFNAGVCVPLPPPPAVRRQGCGGDIAVVVPDYVSPTSTSCTVPADPDRVLITENGATVVYEVGERCSETFQSYKLGQPATVTVDPVPGSPVNIGQGRIKVPGYRLADGSEVRAETFNLHDSALDDACAPRLASDGTPRCLPTWEIFELTTLYSDAACTTPVTAIEASARPPFHSSRFFRSRQRLYSVGAPTRLFARSPTNACTPVTRSIATEVPVTTFASVAWWRDQ